MVILMGHMEDRLVVRGNNYENSVNIKAVVLQASSNTNTFQLSYSDKACSMRAARSVGHIPYLLG